MSDERSLNSTFAAGAICLGLGFVIGQWYGSSNAENRYNRWIMAADLPSSCTRLLYNAADALDGEDEDRIRAGERR